MPRIGGNKIIWTPERCEAHRETMRNRDKIIKDCIECDEEFIAISYRSTRCYTCQYHEKYRQRLRFTVKKHGITLEEFESLWFKSNNKCKLCGVDGDAGRTKRLVVDHCHKSGKVRGLICHECNLALGKVKDSIKTLKNMIKYLEENK